MHTSPGFYQSPYTQPAQNPYMDRLAQMQPPPQPRDGLIRATGMDGARAYLMPPNSAVALFDGGQDVFYVKTTDGAGFPTIRAYSFQPMEQAQAMGASDYVTRAEGEQRKEMSAHGKQPAPADATDAK